jgi:tetratricopeptide (TPR) repeat protein
MTRYGHGGVFGLPAGISIYHFKKPGKCQEAAESFESALRLNPHALDTYNDLTNAYVRVNERPKAIATLEHGLEPAQAAGDIENQKTPPLHSEPIASCI